MVDDDVAGDVVRLGELGDGLGSAVDGAAGAHEGHIQPWVCAAAAGGVVDANVGILAATLLVRRRGCLTHRVAEQSVPVVRTVRRVRVRSEGVYILEVGCLRGSGVQHGEHQNTGQ